MAFGLDTLSNFLKRFEEEVENLGNLNQALGLLRSTSGAIFGLVSPMYGAVQAADEYNKSILNSQIAFSTATQEINAFGNSVENFADRLASSAKQFQQLEVDLEIETRTIVGLTSQRLSGILSEVVQESNSIFGQYTEKAGSSITEVFKNLTSNLAATYSLLGSPVYQDPQETLALLQGQVTDPNSFVANKLNISKQEAEEAQSQGRYIDLLIQKTQAYRTASTLASNSLENITSNLEDIQQISMREFGQPILQTFTKVGSKFFDSVVSTQRNTIQDIRVSTAKGVLAIDKDLQKNREKLRTSTSDAERESITNNITKLLTQRADIQKTSAEKLAGLGDKNANDTINKIVRDDLSIAGREKIIKSEEASYTQEKTGLDSIVGLAQEFGDLFSNLLDKLAEVFAKIGKIFDNLNIGELLESATTGFISGLSASLEAITGVLIGVLSVLETITSGLKGLLDPILNIETGTTVGVIAGVLAALAAFGTVVSGLSNGFLFLIKEASILATTFSTMSRRQQAQVLNDSTIKGFDDVVSGIRTNQTDLRNRTIRQARDRRAAAREGSGPISGFFRSIGDFFGAQAEGYSARTRPDARGRTYGLNPFGTSRRILDSGVTRASRVVAPGFSGIMAKTGIMFQAITAALSSLLPLLLGAVAVIAIVVLGARALNKFVTNLALTEGPFRGIAEAARKLINSLDFLGKYFKKQEESLNRTSNKINKELETPLNRLQEVGGAEGVNRLLVGTPKDYEKATKLQEELFKTYEKSNLILDGRDDKLKEAGYSEEDIKNIKKLRKDNAEVDRIKETQEEIAKAYNNVFNQEIDSGFKQVEQPYKGGFTEGLFSGLNKANSYREKETSAGKGTQTVSEDLENISSSFETLNSQNLLGTESLAIYAETFKLASQNEILGIEERNKFISLYNQAIDKEREITERFLSAAEMMVKAKEKTGEIGQAESELEMARINAERAKADFVAISKKAGVQKSILDESSKKLSSTDKLQEEISRKNIAEVAPLFEKLEELRKKELEVANLTSSIIPELDKKISDIRLVATTGGRITGSNTTKFNENFIEESKRIISKDLSGKEFSTETRIRISNYLEQIDSIMSGQLDKNIKETKKKTGDTRSNEKIVTDYDAILKGFGGGGDLRLIEFILANKERLEKTSAIGSRLANFDDKATKKAIEDFLKTGKVDVEKLSPEVNKEAFVLTIKDAIEEIRSDKKNLTINLKPLFDNSDIGRQITDLQKKISELSGSIIIKFDDNYATKKLKELRAEREKIKSKILSGDSTSDDINKGKSLDRQIDAEETRINRIILKDKAKLLQEEIAGLEKKEKLTEAEQKSLDNAKAKLKVTQDTDKILAEREKSSKEYNKKSVDLQNKIKEREAENKKEKPNQERIKKLEGEEQTLRNDLEDLDKKLNIDRFSKLENAEAALKGNEELNKLTTADLIAKNREVISAEKLYEIEQKITEERKEQERLSISLSRASLEVAKIQNKASGSFTPELFEPEIGQKKIDEIKTQLEQARVSVVENDKKVNETYRSIGSDNIKTTLRNINQLGPEAFKEEMESLSQRIFKDSEEALKFAEKSVNIGVNADRILNANSITQEVKDAYKFIYGKDIDPNINLKNLQNKILNTKGGLTTDNLKAQTIGGIKSDLETGQLTLPEAIKKAQSAGIKGIDESFSKEKLIDTLTVEYGKSLKSDELIKNLDAREQSLVKVQQLESSIKDAVKSQIDALIQLANEEEKRVNRLERIKTLIDTFGTEGISESEADFRNATLDFKEAYSNLQNTELYKNPEKMFQLLGKTSGVTLADLQKLNSRGGLSEQDSNTLQAVLESMKKLTEIAEQRIASVLEKRLKVLELLNIASDIGLGPQAGLLPEERNILKTTAQLENAIFQLNSNFELQKDQDRFTNKESLKEIDVTDSGTMDSLMNIFNAAREALNSFTELSLRKIGDISQKLSQQISIIGSLQSAYQSISQATEIYNSVVSKMVSKEFDYLSQKLQELNQSNEQDENIRQQIEEIKKKGAGRLGGNTPSEERKIAELEGKLSNNTFEKRDIEYKIFRLKEKQIELENLQAEIALRRQATENKIAQLKNKQARLELFSERAKIMALEDPVRRAFELKINDRLLEINKLESGLLQVGGERIQSSIKLQKRLNSNKLEDARREYMNPGKSTLSRFYATLSEMTESINFVENDLKNLGAVDREINQLINNLGTDTTDANLSSILEEAQKNREKVRETLLNSLPKNIYDKLSEETKRDINQDIKNILLSVTDAIKGTGIDSNLKSIEKNTKAIAEKVSKGISANGGDSRKPEPDTGNDNKGKKPSTPSTTSQSEASQSEAIKMATLKEVLKVSGRNLKDIPKEWIPSIVFDNLNGPGGTYNASANQIVIDKKYKNGLLSGSLPEIKLLIHEIRHWAQSKGLNKGNLNIDKLPDGGYKNFVLKEGLPSSGDSYKERDSYTFAGLYGQQIRKNLPSSLFNSVDRGMKMSSNSVENKAPFARGEGEGPKKDLNSFREIPTAKIDSRVSNTFQNLPTVSGITQRDIAPISNLSEIIKVRKESELAKELFTGKSDNSGLSIASKIDRENNFKCPNTCCTQSPVQNQQFFNNNSPSSNSLQTARSSNVTNNFVVDKNYQQEKRPVKFESNNVDVNRFVSALEKIKSGETKISLTPTINVNIPQNVSVPETTLWVNTNNNPESATKKNMEK